MSSIRTNLGFPRSRLGSEEGQSLVEFSLTLFFTIITIFAVLEFGRMVLVYTTVANAARAGARYAIVHGADRTGSGSTGPSGPTCPCSQVNTMVTNFASTGLIDTSRMTINVSYSPDNKAGSTVTVTVSYPYDPFITFFNSLLNVNIGSTSVGVISF